jgi:hypothetical protein
MTTHDTEPATENGKTMAALSYFGFFAGLPLGVLPLLQRDDEFAVFHARHATAVWLATFVAFVVGFFFYAVVTLATCGLGSIFVLPLLFVIPVWPVVVGVHGLVLALNGRREAPFGTLGLGDALFGGVAAKPRG